MSRCFPYPPPGYQLKNGVHELDLIESIKREEKTRKERRKDKKREKKHKKEKSRDDGEKKNKEQSHEKKHKPDSKVEDSLKRKREDETEQLEKSCLTEDQGQNTSSQNLYDSSDSTQNSSKRKKLSPSDSSRTHGSSILLRLPLQKHKSPELRTSKEQVCLISGRTEIVSIKRDETSIRTCKQQSCSTSGRNETQDQDTAAFAVSSTCLSKREPRGLDLQFRDLIENWVPPTMQIERTDFDDQEWLFEMKPQLRHEEKRIKPSESDTCHMSAGWPRACYLPSADIYALPYTVPF